MKSSLTSYFQNINLTQSQEVAVEMIEQFLTNKDDAFVLKGYAGTGKTFILEKLGQYLNLIQRKFCFVAPTGRAAKILSKKAKHDATTIHRLIYSIDPKQSIIEDIDAEEYKLVFKMNVNLFPTDTIFVIDEASMVSDTYSDSENLKFGSGKLLSDLVQFVNCHNTRRKIIFLGDNAQLPPINNKLSPALSTVYLRQKFALECKEFEMIDVYRQAKDSSILKESIIIRNAIREKIYETIAIQANSTDLIDIPIEDSVDTFLRLWESTDEESMILIAQTNAAVCQYNRAIRRELGFKPDDIEVGDQLLVLRNSVMWGIPLFNGDFIRVEEVSTVPEVRRIRLRGLPDEVKLSFRDIKASIRNSRGESVPFSVKVYENLLYTGDRDISRIELRALLVDFKMRNPKLNPSHELFMEKLQRDVYFNALQVKFGYAITGHKSQGGEWKNVIVDFRYSNSMHSEEYFRWLYTAITRAKTQLFMIYPQQSQTNNQNSSSEAQEICTDIDKEFQKYNIVIMDVNYHQYQLIIYAKTHYDEQRVSVHYNSKQEITSFQLLDGVRNIDDQLISLIVESYKARRNNRQSSENRSDILSASTVGLSPHRNEIPFKQSVVSTVQPFLEKSLKQYQLVSVSEHTHMIKIVGLVQGNELVLNIYFNQRQIFTKLYIEKGRKMLLDEDVAQLQKALKQMIRNFGINYGPISSKGIN